MNPLVEELGALLDRFDLDPTQRSTVVERVRTVVDDANSFSSEEELVEWIDRYRAETAITLAEKPITELRKWVIDPDTGVISHETGDFFRIMGVEIGNSEREVEGWDQPMVHQREMGVLGILRCRFDGVWHYLLNAKAEPGNTLLFQISPTLQATYSNLRQAHEGRRPRFAEFFEDDAPYRVVYRQWLAEDGGRFYLKSNLNMLIEVEQTDVEGELPDDFRWFTLSQIKSLLRRDNYINPHVRGILCHL
jgi:dTDP-4-dehydro-6-deoxy-alpha-D-glucopyranose 2,3-dehydratase